MRLFRRQYKNVGNLDSIFNIEPNQLYFYNIALYLVTLVWEKYATKSDISYEPVQLLPAGCGSGETDSTSKDGFVW